jgi:ketosteroid isomerase-like protein
MMCLILSSISYILIFMTPVRMARFESGIRTVLDYHDAFNRHDVSGMMKFITDDCNYEAAAPLPAGVRCVGREAILNYWQDIFHKLPDASMTVEEIFGIGTHCVMRWRLEWSGKANKKEYLLGVDIFHFKNGLISEMYSFKKG